MSMFQSDVKDIALKHVAEMDTRYEDEIADSILFRLEYGGPDRAVKDLRLSFEEKKIILAPMDSVSAAIKYRQGKTAMLNFASNRHPGGGFLSGAMAQEEALCHESTLFNVLSGMTEYYEWNRKHSNKSLYKKRALYTPGIVFERDGSVYKFDVITCAAPNRKAAAKAGVSEQKIHEALEARMDLIFAIGTELGIDTLITGAFGCGVFGNDPREVAILTRRMATYYHIPKIVCAVPPGNRNLAAFEEILGESRK